MYVRMPTSCPICKRCNISTLHVGSLLLKRQDKQDRKAEQWERWGLENGDEREARLARQRLIINVLRDTSVNGKCSERLADEDQNQSLVCVA